MMSKSGRARTRVRTQWLALGAALVVLAGVLVAWSLSNASDRVLVVQLAQAVKVGEPIEAADLMFAGVAYDSAVQGLVPAASLDTLVGRVAAINLDAGVLMQSGMWREATHIEVGEESVGALLTVGRFPADLARGDIALAAPVVPLDATVPATAIAVRVLDAQASDDGELTVTLAVPAAQSVAVAQLAATDQLLLIGQVSIADQAAAALAVAP